MLVPKLADERRDAVLIYVDIFIQNHPVRRRPAAPLFVSPPSDGRPTVGVVGPRRGNDAVHIDLHPGLPRDGPSNLRSQRCRARGQNDKIDFNRHVSALWIAGSSEGMDVFGTFGGRYAEYRLGHYGRM